jgi:hypothetical protein
VLLFWLVCLSVSFFVFIYTVPHTRDPSISFFLPSTLASSQGFNYTPSRCSSASTVNTTQLVFN